MRFRWTEAAVYALKKEQVLMDMFALQLLASRVHLPGPQLWQSPIPCHIHRLMLR